MQARIPTMALAGALAGALFVAVLPFPAPAQSPPAPGAPQIAGVIGGVNPAVPGDLRGILQAAEMLDAAKGAGTVSPAEAQGLTNDLKAKFNAWVRQRADELNPAEWSAKPFFDLQAIQGLSEYDELTDPDAKQYKHDTMKAAWNQWVRNRVDEIDPADPNSLKAFFDLQNIQATDKYAELTTPDTAQYKHDTMGQKFNEWVRNRVDELDPADPAAIRGFFDLQTIQQTDKYDEYATPETHQYKENTMKAKFNEWVRNRVDELDPSSPDYLAELLKLRAVQWCDKYDRFVTPETHAYKEGRLKETFGSFISNVVDRLDPASTNFMSELDKLTWLQYSDIYDDLCPEHIRRYKEQAVARKRAGPPGMPPQVVGVWPAEGQTNVSIRQQVVILFDRPMFAPSVPPAIALFPETPHTIRGMDSNTVWLVQTVDGCSNDTPYHVVVLPSASSEEGLQLPAPVDFGFRTEPAGPPPSVVAVVPPEGAPEAPCSAPLEVVFDRPMWPPSVDVTLVGPSNMPIRATWAEGNTLLHLDIYAPLPFDTAYSLRVAAGAESADGTPMEADFKSHFFTGIHGLASVGGTMPGDGDMDIPPNHPIQVVFDRPMNPQTVEPSLTVIPPLDVLVAWFEANMVLRLEPLRPPASNTTYTIRIGDTARTSFGLPLPGGHAFAFTTVAPLYARPLRCAADVADGWLTILADPGELREYCAALPGGAVPPLRFLHAPDMAGLAAAVAAYRAGLPVDLLVPGAYDRSRHAAPLELPIHPAAPRQVYRAVWEE